MGCGRETGGRTTRRALALLAVKTVHSVIFLVLQTEILYLAYQGLKGRANRCTAIAATMTAVETAVYVGNGYRCPLTAVAEDLGSSHGQVTDIFLPRRLAANIDKIYGPLFALGLLLQVRVLLRRRREAASCVGGGAGS